MNITPEVKKKMGIHEIEQEAKRVFRRLLEAQSYVARLDRYLESTVEFGVFVARNKHKKPIMKLGAAFLTAFIANDWMRRKDHDHWHLSDQGAAWLRRQMAAHEPYRTQHQLPGTKEISIEPGLKRKLFANLGESPLGWLLHRKGADGKSLLSQEQFDAGERLRSEFERAQMNPRITSDLSAVMRSKSKKGPGDAGAAAAMRESALAAKERFFNALDAVGPDLSDVLIEVCCHIKGMEEAEKQLGLPQRSGKIVLQIALTRLCIHYGMSVATKTHRYASPAFRHWGDETYRPKI